MNLDPSNPSGWQAAIDAAPENEVIKIPSGRYKIPTLHLKSGQTLVGSGVDRTLFETENSNPRQDFTKGELCLLIVVALGFLAAVIFGCISIATRMLDLTP